jgi:hypothetical protein
MNLNIEKISNGYLVTLDGKKTFYDVPEAICGATAEWVLAECKRLEAEPTDAQRKLSAALAMAQAQTQMSKLYNDQLCSQWVNYTGE